MKYAKYALLIAIALIAAYFIYATFDLATEVDDLKQSQKDQEQSIKSLIKYAAVNSDCSIKPEDLSKALGSDFSVEKLEGQAEIAHLAFKVHFRDGSLDRLTIVGVGDAKLCSQLNR